MRKLPLLLLAFLACALLSPAHALDDAAVQKVLAGTDARQHTLLEKLAATPPSAERNVMFDYTDFALGAYWLQQKMPEADQAIITACDRSAVRWRGIANAPVHPTSYYRQLYMLERVYFLFNSRSEYFPGRMSPAAQKAVASMLWPWVSTYCRKSLVSPDRIWWQWGTENIGAIMWSSLWGATQIIAADPDYKDKVYADGTSVPDMAKAFNEYYRNFTRERAGKGIFVEVASGYNKWTLNAFYNVADFSPDPVARQRMKMFLDLFWADWAIEQIDAIRGGSKHRFYPGPESMEGAAGGDGPSWYLFGIGQPENTNPAVTSVGTTFYRPAPVVVDLALDVAGRGTYAYVSRRPGFGKPLDKVANDDTDDPSIKENSGSILNPQGGNLLRYTWCTPDFVMGTSMVPALPLDDWARISSQNHWDGVTFGGHETARIYIQPITKKSFYNGDWSMQNKGVMIIQRLKTSASCEGTHIWFDNSLKRVERDGWVFAQAPRAYAAVRVVDGPADWQADVPLAKKAKPGPGLWLVPHHEYSPIILEVARSSDFPDFPSFQKAILANSLTWQNQKLDYRSSFYQTKLTFFADYSKTPEVDGIAVNYNPGKVYDSPFIQGDFGQGVVTITKDARKLTLDFTKE